MAPKKTNSKNRPAAAAALSKAKGKPAPEKKAATGKTGAAKSAGASKSAGSKSSGGRAKGAGGDKKAGAAKGGADRSETRSAKLRAIREAASKAADAADADSDDAKRNFGLRGAAPWVARHAAKHAEELRKRNAEPPPPGSARATLRTPKEAAEIKNKISVLHQRTSSINNLRKKLDKTFYEIGELLDVVQREHLFEAKGYATFESFLDREIEVPRPTALKLVRLVHTFDREVAQDYPLERLLAALSALDGELVAPPASQAAASNRSIVGSGRGFSSPTLPPKPPIRWD